VQALLAEAAPWTPRKMGIRKGEAGRRLPKVLARRESRLEKIREAKAALEQEAREAAAQKQAEVEAQLKEREKQERERDGSSAGDRRRRRTRKRRSRSRKRNGILPTRNRGS